MPRLTEKHLAVLATVASAVLGFISWLYLTFATVQFVEARFSPVEKRLELIDQRTWEMNGRKDPPPLNMKPIRAPSGK